MPAVELDTLRRIGSLPPLTERQALRRQINRAGGRLVGEQTFEDSKKIRFSQETTERLLNGRSETISMVGKGGVIYWGFNERKTWIGIEAGKEKVSFVLEKGEDPQGYHSILGNLVDKWPAELEEIKVLVDFRDELLAFS